MATSRVQKRQAGDTQRLRVAARSRLFTGLDVSTGVLMAVLGVALLTSTTGCGASATSGDAEDTASVTTQESTQPVPPTPARLELATDSIELGHIPQDVEVEYLLEITNTGGEPLNISEVRSS